MTLHTLCSSIYVSIQDIIYILYIHTLNYKSGLELVKENRFGKFFKQIEEKGPQHTKIFLDLRVILRKMRRVLTKFFILIWLKLVSAIFYQIFNFTSNDRPSKTLKNVFYFIEKALFVLEILTFL